LRTTRSTPLSCCGSTPTHCNHALSHHRSEADLGGGATSKAFLSADDAACTFTPRINAASQVLLQQSGEIPRGFLQRQEYFDRWERFECGWVGGRLLVGVCVCVFRGAAESWSGQSCVHHIPNRWPLDTRGCQPSLPFLALPGWHVRRSSCCSWPWRTSTAALDPTPHTAAAAAAGAGECWSLLQRGPGTMAGRVVITSSHPGGSVI
jgi:hypothetical protein